MLADLEYLTFSSSGSLAFVFEGILRALEDLADDYDGWRAALRGFSGTSGGAIYALVCALGLGRTQRAELLQPFLDFESVFATPDVLLLMDRFGIEDGATLRGHIERVLMAGGLSPQTSMGDLRRLLRVDVVFVAHDLIRGVPVWLNAETVPDMLASEAVFASCCIPFMFAPVAYGEMRLCDGFLSEYVPLTFPRARTLFVVVPPCTRVPALRTWMDFLRAILNTTAGIRAPEVAEILALPRTLVASHPLLGDEIDLRSMRAGHLMIACGYTVGMARARPDATELLGRLTCARLHELAANPETEGDAPESEVASEGDPGE